MYTSIRDTNNYGLGHEYTAIRPYSHNNVQGFEVVKLTAAQFNELLPQFSHKSHPAKGCIGHMDTVIYSIPPDVPGWDVIDTTTN